MKETLRKQSAPAPTFPKPTQISRATPVADGGTGAVGAADFHLGDISILGSGPASHAYPSRLPLQAKLIASHATDSHEIEAERVASHMAHTVGGGSPLARTPSPVGVLHRKPATTGPGQGIDLSSSTEEHIRSVIASGGQTLPASTRAPYEQYLGRDLSHVRVHINPHATAAVGARAFTVGRDIVFGAGQYQPRTPSGQELLAHELTHVVQQSDAGGRPHSLQRKPDGDRFITWQSPAEHQKDEAESLLKQKPLSKMSEEELLVIVFNPEDPKHKPRYIPVDGKLEANYPGVVTQKQFEEAEAILGQIQARKGVKGDWGSLGRDRRRWGQEDGWKELNLSHIRARSGWYSSDEGWKSAKTSSRTWRDHEIIIAQLRHSEESIARKKQMLKNIKDIPRAERNQINRPIVVTLNQETARYEKLKRQSRTTGNKLTKAMATADASPRIFRKPSFEKSVSGDLVSLGEQREGHKYKNVTKDQDDVFGSKSSQAITGLGGEASGNLSLKVSNGKLRINASTALKADLVAYRKEWKWSLPNLNFLNEVVSFSGRVFVDGMLGAEAKTSLEANFGKGVMNSSNGGVPKLNTAKLTRGTGLVMDPQKGSVKAGQGVVASAGAFAGAKLQVGVGAAAEWQKKDHSAYTTDLNRSAALILKLISSAHPPLGWVLKRMHSQEALAWVLNQLVRWGKPGNVPIFDLTAAVEGSAGAGASAGARVGLQNGQLRLKFGASATWGLGWGASVDLALDLVEGIKFALITLGGLEQAINPWLQRQKEQMINSMFSWSFSDWLNADDKAREAVANGAHTVMGYRGRAKTIKVLLDFWAEDADQKAVVEILRFTKSRGDMSQLLTLVDQEYILRKLWGDEDTKARQLMAATGRR